MTTTTKPIAAMIITGLLSAVLYALIYLYEADILRTFTRSDELYWLLPVITAFVFSFVHGAFTGYFWEVLGVRPRRLHK